jgi:arylsulfatase A-like enzyme
MPSRLIAISAFAAIAVPAPASGASRPVLTRHPSAATALTTATFRWRPASRPARCRLDGGRWLACRSPRRYRGLKAGRHVFRVRLGRLGKVSSFAWTVRRPPVLPAPLPSPTGSASSEATTPSDLPVPAAPQPGAPGPSRLAGHVILVDWDGFDPSLLSHGWNTPTLDALIARGTASTTAQSTFTTFSNSARASMSTGAYPETHHNVAWTWDQATNTVLGQTRVLDAESVAESLARGGLNEASVQWYMVQDHGVQYGDSAHLYVQPGGDWGNRVDTAIKILNRQPVKSNGVDVTVPRIPDFLAVYSSDPDELEHAEGTNGPDIRGMVEQHDADLGRLVQATKDVGIYDQTAFVLTADHGMSNWTTSALQKLKDAVASAGFSYEVLYADEHAASGTEVIVNPAVRVAYVHLRGAAATDAGRLKVRTALTGHAEFPDVLDSTSLAALHASQALGDFVVEAKPPYSFAKADASPGTERGAHGSRAESDVPLLLSGAGVGHATLGGSGLVDVGPTIAALLHAPCPADAQGRALTEAFTAPAVCT